MKSFTQKNISRKDAKAQRKYRLTAVFPVNVSGILNDFYHTFLTFEPLS